MSAFNFETLLAHVGHKIEVISYGKGEVVFIVAIACESCNEILLEYDNEEDDENEEN